MKRSSLLLTTLLIILFSSAQVPQALNYQAVARNSMGQIIPSQSIGVRFSITDSTGNSTLYQETHSTTTNNFGLFTLAIGKGTAITGSLSTIDWSITGKTLKVEIAPAGGSNYTLQGTTRLLSVPYALYADRTHLVAGPGITISGGNTISSGAWLLSGNAATTPSSYVGTSDNQPLRIKTNNIARMSFNSGVTDQYAGNVGTVFISDFNSVSSAPGQLAVYGKDIPGVSEPAYFANSVTGMNWAPQGGGNNTMGRSLRLVQFATNNEADGSFYDFGQDQGQSFFISEQGIQGGGPQLFKKMFTISPQDYVGINFNWGENPTANFHTKGTIRFEGIANNNGFSRILVVDANGNLATRDASTLTGSGSEYWLPDANGIYYNTANVGIGGNSRNDAALTVTGNSTQNWTADLTTANTWETAINVRNTSMPNTWFQFVLGGSANNVPAEGVGPGNFGILNARDGLNTTLPLIITSNDMVGIGGGLGGTNFTPKARLDVRNGDIYIEDVNSGVIMKSPNGQCWRMTVSNAGAPVFTAIACP